MKYSFPFLTLICACLLCCRPSGEEHNTVTIALNPLQDYPCLELKGEVLDLSDSLYAPVNIEVMDSLLVIDDDGYRYMEHDFLRFYSLNTGKLIHRFGGIGRGPGEFQLPRFFKDDRRRFLIIEKLKYYLLDVDSMLRVENYRPCKFEVNDWLKAAGFACLRQDSILIFQAMSEYQLIFMRLNGDSTGFYKNYPDFAKQGGITDFIASTNVYSADFGVRPGRKDLVNVAYHYFPAVDIVALDGLKTTRVHFPVDRTVNQVQVLDELNAEITNKRLYYRTVYNTANYMWLLYCGDPEMLDGESVPKTEIHRFTWDGVFAGRYDPGWNIRRFCVDESEKNIYALSLNDEYETVILHFKLPE